MGTSNQREDEQITYMVNRFLQWKLPKDFQPDCGIHFDANAAKKLNPNNHTYEPVGTNLLTADQAKEMVRFLIDGLPSSGTDSPEHDSYVAWLRWSADENHRHLVVCDSDSPGAFRAYRRPASDRIIEESLDRLHDATKVELVRIGGERSFWERKYRALEDFCFRKLIPQHIEAFARITGSALCRHEDVEVSLKDERGYNVNGYWAKCRSCGFIITDSNGYPPGYVMLEEIDKLKKKAAELSDAVRDTLPAIREAETSMAVVGPTGVPMDIGHAEWSNRCERIHEARVRLEGPSSPDSHVSEHSEIRSEA